MSSSFAALPVFREFSRLLPAHWCRRRGSLGPPQVMLSVMTMSVLGCMGYERTLDEMKKHVGEHLGWHTDADVPSASALCQARRKLDASRCASLVTQVYSLCSTARSTASLGYGGFRLLALDGTKLALPAYKVFRDHFGCPSQGVGRELAGPQASLSVLWDIGANQPVAWRLDGYRTSEQTQALDLASNLGAGDLLLGDRNVPSRRFLTYVHGRKTQVLMRIRAGQPGCLHEVTAFFASSSADMVCSVEARDEYNRPLPQRTRIPIRLLRAILPDGSIAVYLTTLLDQVAHPLAALVALYAQRWRIETAFRELKLWHGLERFHARHVDGIAQEIAALMIFQLLASELEARARLAHAHSQLTTLPPPTQPNRLHITAVRFNRRIVADCAFRILFAAANGDNINDTLRYAFFRIWRYRQKPKPGRSFPRVRKSPHRGWKPRGSTKKGNR